MIRLFSIGMIAVAIGCTEPNPHAMGDTSSGTTDGTTTMSTTIDPTTVSTTIDPTTTTMSTTVNDTSGESTTMPVDTSSGDEQCDSTSSICVPLAPDGWLGPAALRYSDPESADPGCTGAYSEVGIVAFTDYEALAEHTCECECNAPVGVDCIYPVPMSGDTTPDCPSPIDSINVTNACQQLPAALQISADEFWRAVSGPDERGCTPDLTENPGYGAFENRVTVCGAGETSQLSCSDQQTCAPRPGAEHDGNICVWRTGDVECPAEWTIRSLSHQGTTDTQDCTACTCGDLTADCTGSIYLFGTTDCTNAPLVNVPIGSDSCQQGAVAATVRSARINQQPEPGDVGCQPSISKPTGSVELRDPVTVCCLAPD